jgi:hypothetical protein
MISNVFARKLSGGFAVAALDERLHRPAQGMLLTLPFLTSTTVRSIKIGCS